MPSKEDNKQLENAAIDYLMRFMARRFRHLQHLANACPQDTPFKPPRKTQVAPLETLDINEGSTDGNIRILEQFARDICKSDPVPVVISTYKKQ